MARARQIRRFLYPFFSTFDTRVHIALLVIFTLTTLLDAFGVSRFSDKLSSDVFNTFAAPMYGTGEQAGASVYRKGRDEIVVLLFDDDYMDLRPEGQKYIAPLSIIPVLRLLAEYGASIVFLDFRPEAKSSQYEIDLGQFQAVGARLEDMYGTKVVYGASSDNPTPVFDNSQARYYGLIDTVGSNRDAYPLSYAGRG